MNKYKVHFTQKGIHKYKREIDVVYGYSEDDALIRNGYDRHFVSFIYEFHF